MNGTVEACRIEDRSRTRFATFLDRVVHPLEIICRYAASKTDEARSRYCYSQAGEETLTRPVSRAGGWLLSALLALGGCATPPSPGDSGRTGHATRAAALSAVLAGIGPGVDAAEAAELARVAVFYPLELSARYQLTTPPLWHNTLVNLGIKPRGLCVEWAQDLLDRLHQIGASTLQLHWGIANQDALFRLEHYAVIVTARGQPFRTGIVLDPWRNSGALFWAPLTGDRQYTWLPLHEGTVERAEAPAASSPDR